MYIEFATKSQIRKVLTLPESVDIETAYNFLREECQLKNLEFDDLFADPQIVSMHIRFHGFIGYKDIAYKIL